MTGQGTYLLGGNGAPNFGDELMAKAWLDDLSARFPQSQITLDCNSIKTPPGFFDLENRGINCLSGIKIFTNTEIKQKFGAKNSGAGEAFLASLRYGLDFLRSGSHAEFPQLREALEAIEDARTFHIFGGGYINSGIRPDSGFLLGFAAAVKRQFGTRVFATGIGITPLYFDGRHSVAPLAEALAEFDLFECRDSYGYDKLFNLVNNQATLVNGVDDTFLLPYAARAAAGGASRLHLSFLRQEPTGDQASVIDEVLELAPGFDEVTYWNCVPNLQDRNLERLRDAIPRLEVIDCHPLVHREIPAGPGEVLITQRFHPHLIAARLGCSGVFVQEGAYYNDKHRSVVHLGSPFRRYEPGTLAAAVAAGQAAGPAPILAREAENRARKARVREACYGGLGA